MNGFVICCKPQFSGEWVKLGDVAKIRTGKLDANAADEDGLYPFFTCAEKTLRINTAAYDCECVLVAGNGDLNVKYFNGKFNAYQRTYIIESKGDKELHVPYLYRFLSHYVNTLRKESIGGVIKYIKLGSLAGAHLQLPSMEQQMAICGVLDSIDRVDRYCLKELDRLDKLVKSRFNELFGKVAENNLHFPVIKLDDVCTSIVRGPFGSALKKEFFVPKGPGTYKVYEQKHAIQKQADIGIYYIDGDRYESLNRFECHPGDILMSCSGTMGELYQLPPNCEPGVINQALCKFSLSDAIQVEYFLGCMNQIVDQLGAKGSGIKNVSSVKFIKAIEIPLPPITLQRDFATFSVQVDKLRFMLLGNPSPIYRSRSFC